MATPDYIMRTAGERHLANPAGELPCTEPAGRHPAHRGLATVQAVWVDNVHPIIRSPLVMALLGEGLPVVGESVALQPQLRPSASDVHIFPEMAGSLPRPAALSAYRKLGLVATIRRTWTAKRADVSGPRFTATLLIDELMPDGLAATLGVIAANRNALSAGTEIMEQRSHPEALVGGMGMHLTTREREVLQRLADGGDTRTIAYAMHYSERTVKYVVHATLTKLNCRTRAQAVGLAVKYGLI